jgi:hypothetical protein
MLPESSLLLQQGRSWKDRLDDVRIHVQASAETPFPRDNAQLIQHLAMQAEKGARLVVNMGNGALLSLLDEGRYLNAYQMIAAGLSNGAVRISDTRRRIDAVLMDNGLIEEPGTTWFAAVSLEGTGIRFYGEYAVALKPQKQEQVISYFDRNCYHIIDPPLRSWDTSQVCTMLKSNREELKLVIAAKVLLRESVIERLLTAGQVADALLCDEDYVEAYVGEEIASEDIEEVRDSAANATLANEIRQRAYENRMPSLAEVNWLHRREVLLGVLERQTFPTRLVLSSGRTGRWG